MRTALEKALLKHDVDLVTVVEEGNAWKACKVVNETMASLGKLVTFERAADELAPIIRRLSDCDE